MFKELITNDKKFNYIFKMLLITTFFIAIEVFTGVKTLEDEIPKIENVIYQNLIQEDKNNKMELKNFKDITGYEYRIIKSKKASNLYKDLTLEERIIHNYILMFNKIRPVQSKEKLQKELNEKYDDFKYKAVSQYQEKRFENVNSLAITCLIMFFGLTIYAVLKDSLESFVIGLLFLIKTYFLMYGLLPNFGMFFTGLIASLILINANFKKHSIIRKFEQHL